MSNFTDEEAAFLTEHGNKVSACFATLLFLERTFNLPPLQRQKPVFWAYFDPATNPKLPVGDTDKLKSLISVLLQKKQYDPPFLIYPLYPRHVIRVLSAGGTWTIPAILVMLPCTRKLRSCGSGKCVARLDRALVAILAVIWLRPLPLQECGRVQEQGPVPLQR
jgi:hypothetical protein